MNISKATWISIVAIFGILLGIATSNQQLTLADDSEGIAWRGSFVPCNPQICGGFVENSATLSLRGGGVIVKNDGTVKIKLRRVSSLETGAVLANKTLEVHIGSFTQGVFQNYLGPNPVSLVGTITTDAKGNFEGPIDLGGGTSFVFPSGSVVSAQFALNEPNVRTEFITGFQIP
jgi:hypothetical protein